MYSRAFSTLGCGEMTLTQVAALAERHQLDGVELRALEGTIELPDLFARRFGSAASLAQGIGVKVVALDASFRLLDGSTEEREKLLEWVPWAEAMEVPWIRVFDGKRALDAQALAAAAEALTWWQRIRRARSLRTDLMIETHDTLLDAERIGRFVRAMPAGSVHLLWDAHHTWRRGGEDPLTTWQTIRSHTVHLHIKDSVRDGATAAGFRYVLPGAGEFPMTSLRPVLGREFGGAVSLEWERFWQPALPSLEEVLRAATASGWW